MASSGLPALFARVERLLEYVEHVETCCDALEQRVAQAEAAYTPQKANAVTKLFSSFMVTALAPPSPLPAASPPLLLCSPRTALFAGECV